jgi:putative spermidine/putrescine transport system substrate-binding protein
MKKRLVTILALCSLMTVLLVLTGCSRTKATGSEPTEAKKKWDGQTLVICSWGGAIQDAQRKTLFEAFTAQYGGEIIETTDPDPAKLQSMVSSGNMEIDVWDVDSDFAPRGIAKGLFEPLDFSVINKEGLVEAFVTDYSVPSEIATLCITWNTDQLTGDDHPETWSEYFDATKYPGKRTLYANPMSMFETVALASGVDPKELYPLDVDRIFTFLDEHRSDILTFWSSGAQSVDLVTGGDATFGEVWGGRVIAAKKSGQNIELERKGAILTGDSWIIGKGSKNVGMAMDFIAFATSPEVTASYSIEYPGNSPANLNAYSHMTQEQIDALVYSPSMADYQYYVDVNWWFENYDSVYERFQNWLIQ